MLSLYKLKVLVLNKNKCKYVLLQTWVQIMLDIRSDWGWSSGDMPLGNVLTIKIVTQGREGTETDQNRRRDR